MSECRSVCLELVPYETPVFVAFRKFVKGDQVFFTGEAISIQRDKQKVMVRYTVDEGSGPVLKEERFSVDSVTFEPNLTIPAG